MKYLAVSAVAISMVLVGCVRRGQSARDVAQDTRAFRSPPVARVQKVAPVPLPEGKALAEMGPAYVVETDYVVSRGKRRNSYTAPTVAIPPRQQASISMVKQQSFVQDFDLEVVQDAYIADPIIGVIQDGLTLELIPAPRQGAPDTAWFAFHATVADLQEPIRTRRIRFQRRGRPGTIQLPAIDLAQSVGVRAIALDQRTLLATLPAPDGDGRVEVYVRITTRGDVHAPLEPTLKADAATPDLSPLEAGDDSVLGVDLVGDEPDLRALLTLAEESESASAGVGLRIIRIADWNHPEPVEGPIPEAEARAILKGRHVQTMERLRLASVPIVGATTSALRQTAYIQDFDVPVPLAAAKPNGKPAPVRVQAFDPIIGTIMSGYFVRVAEDAGTRRLQLAVAQQVKPMQSFGTRLKGVGKVTIELPELRVLNRKIELKPGRWLVPLGNTIVRTKHGDEVWVMAVWVDNSSAE